MYADRAGHKDMAELLLQYGAKDAREMEISESIEKMLNYLVEKLSRFLMMVRII